MGATYMSVTVAGCSGGEAHEALLAHFREQGYTDADDWGDDGPVPWPDPFSKGWRQVWDEPVPADAIEWMRGWTAQHPPAEFDPEAKWGPWMAFPLTDGGWHFYGWVNT